MRVCRKCSLQSSGENKICRACGGITEEIPDAEIVEEQGPPRRKGRMRAKAENAAPSAPARARHPLGLPAGSVRALLTLLVVAVVVMQVARGHEVELLWTETLMIALAHYFTSRRFISLSPEVVRRLTAEGSIDTEGQPLGLPKNSIRAMIILAFLGLTAYLLHEGRLLQSQAVPLLGVVFAYLVGIMARAKTFRGWEDLKAGVVIAVMLYAAASYFFDAPQMLPPAARNAVLALALFYYGSR